MAKCPFCGQKKPWFRTHQCPNQKTTRRPATTAPTSANSTREDNGDFATSMAIGYATNNPILGGIGGGNMLGGIVGASLNHHSAEQSHQPPAPATSPVDVNTCNNDVASVTVDVSGPSDCGGSFGD